MARKKMDPTWKAKWLKALRSKKYKQAQHALVDGEAYCCLGVAHDLLVKGKKATWEDPAAAGQPARLADLLGWKQLELLGITNGTQQALATLNDVEGYDFPAIADWVEENL